MNISKPRLRLPPDSCGCGSGAVVMIIFGALSAIWYGYNLGPHELSVGARCMRVAFWAFLGMGLGKAIGIARHKSATKRQPAVQTKHKAL
jgi:hypothetical protein